MQLPLANTLADLRAKYSADEIVAKVREYYEEVDKIEKIGDGELFAHAYKDYCSYAPGIKHKAQQAYIDYCLRQEVSLEFVRCLLPNKVTKQPEKVA